jgi:hypothetical protein
MHDDRGRWCGLPDRPEGVEGRLLGAGLLLNGRFLRKNRRDNGMLLLRGEEFV